MDRRDRLIELIAPGSSGIEIGAWFAPLVPKREGWQSVVLDVFPTEELHRRAVADPLIPRNAIERIEDVDLVGSAVAISELAEAAGHAPGSLDFVISSHNFEHLPDPLRFLQGVERLLRPGGVLSMAIPDRRTCFDHLRPASTLGQLLEAHAQRRESPSPAQVFDHCFANAEQVLPNGHTSNYFPLDGFQGTVRFADDPAEAFALMQGLQAGTVEGYQDAHCWAFSPAEFALLIADLRLLGLTGLELVKPITAAGIEFIVALRKPLEDPASAPATLEIAKPASMRCWRSGGTCTGAGWPGRQIVSSGSASSKIAFGRG